MKQTLNYTVVPHDWQNLEYIISDMSRALSRKLDDDNPMSNYILASGIRPFTGNQSMGVHKLTNVVDPTVDQDAATKKYVDDTIAAGAFITLADLSSTATGLTYTNTTGVFSLTAGYVIPTTTEETNWNTAYGWGNHASGGYLKADGTVALAGNWSLGGYNLTSVGNITGTDVDLSLGTGQITTSGGLSTGTATFTSTTLPLSLRYDASNYIDATVASDGSELTLESSWDTFQLTLFRGGSTGVYLAVDGDDNLTISTDGGSVLITDPLTVNTTLVLASGSITDTTGTISFVNENLNTSGVLTVTGISRLDGGVGIGIDPTLTNIINTTKSQVAATRWRNENTNATHAAYAETSIVGDVVQLNIRAWSSGTTYTFLGETMGGWTQILSAGASSNGLLIGTYQAGDHVVLGTEQIRAIKIDGTNQDVKIGLDDTNHTKIDTAGHMTFNGTATVWNDLQFQVSSAKVPASNFPNWEAFTTNTYEYAFDVDEYAYLMANELHHGWKEGTAANVHLHITNKTAQETAPNGDTNQYAKFTVYIAYADTDEAWQETSLTAELTIPTGTSALTNFYLDMGDLTLTNYLLGAQIKCTVKRIAATGGTEYADSTFITQVGIHLEEDAVGSNAEFVK